MKKWLFLMPLLVVTMSLQAQKNVSIPVQVSKYLEKELKGWETIDTANYVNWWKRFYETPGLPYFVSAMVNGDTLPDYGVIVKKGKEIRLILLLSTGNELKHWIAPDFLLESDKTLRDFEYGLDVQPRGIVEGLDGSLKLKNEGIILTKYEASTRLYYISKRDFKTFWISD